ncbi:hypothetical protein NEDG_01608 [Nematocida displodere]|uniref:Uncharacterized protein n=1 Tax=Nematocida displodere TaxID=1805483 RepID=A0A177EGU6_9MICR|nr:hypothetical protein NEDG_01608 [Nematocida displodere]
MELGQTISPNTSKYIGTIKSWEPMKMMIEDGFPEEEIEIIAKTLSETLESYKKISKSDSIVEQLEDFLFQVLEEYEILLDDDVLCEFSKRIISFHNKLQFQ